MYLKGEIMSTTFTQNKQIPTGQVKTFGDVGISYIVGELIEKLSDGDILVSIELLPSGEQEQYRLSKLLLDPVVV